MEHTRFLTTLTRMTPCPGCGRKRLEFILRCDLEDRHCLPVAHCRACDRSLEIVLGSSDPPGEIFHRAAERCSTCGGRERQTTMHCETASRQCVVTLECPSCAGRG